MGQETSVEQKTAVNPNRRRHWNEDLVGLDDETEDGWSYDSMECFKGDYAFALRANYVSNEGFKYWTSPWAWNTKYTGLQVESFRVSKEHPLSNFPKITLFYKVLAAGSCGLEAAMAPTTLQDMGEWHPPRCARHGLESNPRFL